MNKRTKENFGPSKKFSGYATALDLEIFLGGSNFFLILIDLYLLLNLTGRKCLFVN